MPCRDRLEHILREEGVEFELRRHPRAFSAQEVAAHEHVSGREVAKVVMIGTERGLGMAVLPAYERVDLDRVADALEAEQAWLAHETDFHGTFDDCEVGAMPAFGHLYGIPVVVDNELAAQEWILTQAGTHEEAIRLRYRDFQRIEHPRVAEIGAH